MEFTGDGIKNLSMADRFTMANMAIEAGAKNGIFPVDEKTEEYLKEHTKKEYKVYEADEDAEYESVVEIDLSSGTYCSSGCTCYGRSGNTEDLQTVYQRRPSGNLRRRRMCSQHTKLWTLYGWTYGCYGSRRKMCIYNKP